MIQKITFLILAFWAWPTSINSAQTGEIIKPVILPATNAKIDSLRNVDQQQKRSIDSLYRKSLEATSVIVESNDKKKTVIEPRLDQDFHTVRLILRSLISKPTTLSVVPFRLRPVYPTGANKPIVAESPSLPKITTDTTRIK